MARRLRRIATGSPAAYPGGVIRLAVALLAALASLACAGIAEASARPWDKAARAKAGAGLSVAARKVAAELARPTDPFDSDGYKAPSRYLCGNVCVHWVESTTDAPSLRDAEADGIPDWVQTTASVLETIWAKEIVEFGFRAPKSDLEISQHGPDGRLDVYLKDIADDVLGYCAPEIPPGYRYWNVPGYCVLDDDYSPGQLGAPNLTGRRGLELTAAHEFFHAIQFGYDFGEDGWLMEGQAVWMEDKVFEALHGSFSWFPYTSLLHPEVPLDTFGRTQPFQHGSSGATSRRRSHRPVARATLP